MSKYLYESYVQQTPMQYQLEEYKMFQEITFDFSKMTKYINIVQNLENKNIIIKNSNKIITFENQKKKLYFLKIKDWSQTPSAEEQCVYLEIIT